MSLLRMLTLFVVERDRDDVPADVFHTGLAPFIRKVEDGSNHEVVVIGRGCFPEAQTNAAI